MKTRDGKRKILTFSQKIVAAIIAAVMTLSGLTALIFAAAGDQGIHFGGTAALGNWDKYIVWQDGPTIENPTQGWDADSLRYFKARIEQQTGRPMSDQYSHYYETAAFLALQHARERSHTAHSRIVGVMGVYSKDYGSTMALAEVVSFASMVGARAGTSSELPDSVGWSTYYNDPGVNENWRDYILHRGLRNADAYSATSRVTLIVFAVAENEPVGYGKAKLHKTSSRPDFVNNNRMYSLAGGQFQVTGGPDHNYNGTFTTNADGSSNTLEKLKPGDYTVTEVKAPTGYKLDRTPKNVHIDAGKTATVDFSDIPLDDPIVALVQKSIKGNTTAGTLAGDTPSLEGIRFRVDYYDGIYSSDSDARSSGSPKASAVFATDRQGLLNFAYSSPVEGSWNYKSSQGTNTSPLGTLVITELDQKPGLKTLGIGRVLNIVKNGDDGVRAVPVQSWPINQTTDGAVAPFENAQPMGGVTVTKADAELHRSYAQGDANLENVSYEIVNKSANPVTVSGQHYNVGDVVWRGKTAYDPTSRSYKVSSGVILPYGTYMIRETAPSTGYLNANWSKTFQVREDNSIKQYSDVSSEWNENQVMKGGVKVVKADKETETSVPQGDGTLSKVSYDIINKSKANVVVNGHEYSPNQVVQTITTAHDDSSKTYVAYTGNTLPYGTYQIVEKATPDSYHNANWTQTFEIRDQGQTVEYTTKEKKWNENQVVKGGVEVTKADTELHRSYAQGDATLNGVTYDIINDSQWPVFVDGRTHANGEVVHTMHSQWDEASKSYKVESGNILPYGTYIIKEKSPSVGYLNAGWSKRFTIRTEGQKQVYDTQAHEWNENQVMKGGVIITKIDRETKSAVTLGEAHLDSAVFSITNRSHASVFVNGQEYKPGEVVKTIPAQLVDGRYVAKTGEHELPYGTYEVREISSGSKGYILDEASKNWSRTFQIREDGKLVDKTVPSNDGKPAGDITFENQVLRQDWNFKKKDEDTMERMARVPFLITSNTTGESHVIVTDENGTWGSSWNAHSHNTNANDPDSPNTNGAIVKNADGEYEVKDVSKLDSEAGTWFTGLPVKDTVWAKDGASYTVNGVTVKVDDKLRSFPYDTYTVKELPAQTNYGHKLVKFTVTLHKYGKPSGNGLDLDYGTIDNKVIHIHTELTYGKDGKVAPAGDNTTVQDSVIYDNLNDGEYTLNGELHLINAEGKDEGKVAEASKTFTVENGESTGKQTVTFKVNTSGMDGKKLVAFEYLNKKGRQIAKHENPKDEDQTVRIPKIGTVLTGDVDHEANASAETVKLTDTVNYNGLEVGKTYTMTGTLMDKETGKPVTDGDGKVITASTDFTPAQPDGQTTVVFEFSGVDLSGRSVVAFEKVSNNNVTFAVHTDIKDPNQTVTFPKVRTNATDKADGDQELGVSTKQTVVDRVTTHNLVVGKTYTVTGTLHLQKNVDGAIVDGGAITAEGKLATSDKDALTVVQQFTADKPDMEIELEFTFDTTPLAGNTVVAFETLSRDNVPVGAHANITDKSQSVNIPKIGTTLTDVNNSHDVSLSDHKVERKNVTSSVVEGSKVKVIDHVRYEKLTPGKKYVAKGVLHLQNVDSEGNITDGGAVDGAEASVEFTPDQPDGVVEVPFEFDAFNLRSNTVVAFEEVYRDQQLVAVHSDITDANQTVKIVKVHTTAVDGVNKSHTLTDTLGKTNTITVEDVVKYSNLTVGKTYLVNGALHIQNKGDNGKVTDGGIVKDVNGNPVTSGATFTPKTPDGSVKVTFVFTVPAGSLDGKTVVAFEDLYRDGILVATHSDITDESQSVSKLKVGTYLTGSDGAAKEVPANNPVDLIDKVKFEGLTVGKTYVLKGKLVNGEGKAILDANGKEVTSEAKFTPDTTDGTTEMKFTLDTSKMRDGDKIVAFEYVYDTNGVLVGHHENHKDANQTVVVKKNATVPPTTHVSLKTGVDTAIKVAGIALALIAMTVGAYAYIRRKNC